MYSQTTPWMTRTWRTLKDRCWDFSPQRVNWSGETLAISTCKSSSGASNVLLNIRTITILQIGSSSFSYVWRKAYSIHLVHWIQKLKDPTTSNTNIKDFGRKINAKSLGREKELKEEQWISCFIIFLLHKHSLRTVNSHNWVVGADRKVPRRTREPGKEMEHVWRWGRITCLYLCYSPVRMLHCG